jgi:hypothetical protein
MAYSFQLLKLLMSEINQLESLRRLETTLQTAPTAAGKQTIRSRIDVVMEEIALSNRMIRDYKANYQQGALN